jgi:O-antigen/teichoic acid export membrane protein
MSLRSVVRRARPLLLQESEFATVIRGAGLALLIRSLAGAVGYATAILFARWMGPVDYGYYSFAVTAMTLLAYPATLGLPGAAIRFAAQYAAANDWGHVAGLFKATSWVTFACSTTFGLAGIAVVVLLSPLINSGYAAPMIAALAGVPVVALTMVRSEATRGLGWLTLAWGPLQLGQPLLLLIAAFVIVLAVQSLSATLAVGIAVLAYVAMLIGQWGTLRARLGSRIHTESKIDLRLWLGVALSFLWISIANNVLAQAGVILVGFLLSPKDVAIYNAAATTSLLITYFMQSTNALSSPRFATLYVQNRHVELQALFTNVIRWTFWPSLALALLLIAFGSPILHLFGPDFEQGHLVLVILTLGQLVNVFTGPALNLLNMTGHHAASAWVVGPCAVLYVLFGLVATPPWGNVGVAVASAVTTLLANAWLAVLVARKLGIYSSVVTKFGLVPGGLSRKG